MKKFKLVKLTDFCRNGGNYSVKLKRKNTSKVIEVEALFISVSDTLDLVPAIDASTGEVMGYFNCFELTPTCLFPTYVDFIKVDFNLARKTEYISKLNDYAGDVVFVFSEEGKTIEGILFNWDLDLKRGNIERFNGCLYLEPDGEISYISLSRKIVEELSVPIFINFTENVGEELNGIRYNIPYINPRTLGECTPEGCTPTEIKSPGLLVKDILDRTQLLRSLIKKVMGVSGTTNENPLASVDYFRFTKGKLGDNGINFVETSLVGKGYIEKEELASLYEEMAEFLNDRKLTSATVWLKSNHCIELVDDM